MEPKRPDARPAEPDRLYLAVCLLVLLGSLALQATTGLDTAYVTGAALTWVGAIVGYRFGSSEGSKRKTEIITGER